jgi:hypothetical protein
MMLDQDFAFSDVPPQVAVQRLFDLSEAELRETVLACARAYLSESPLHPKGAGGSMAWMEGTKLIRSVMIPKGWRIENPGNQPRVVSPDGKHAITVICGDEHTGNHTRTPMTRNKKGRQTSQGVSYNVRQTELFPVSREELQRYSPHSDQTLWILLFYVDKAAGEVRYELSRPINMSENEKVDDWKPRFIMPSLKLGDNINPEGPEPSSDIDIPVIPRS